MRTDIPVGLSCVIPSGVFRLTFVHVFALGLLKLVCVCIAVILFSICSSIATFCFAVWWKVGLYLYHIKGFAMFYQQTEANMHFGKLEVDHHFTNEVNLNKSKSNHEEKKVNCKHQVTSNRFSSLPVSVSSAEVVHSSETKNKNIVNICDILNRVVLGFSHCTK